MGFFSGGPAIWELADPRSTLRQVGGTVEILVRTATLATFRDAGLSAPNASALPHPDVGEFSATRHELFSGTPLQHAKPDCWTEGLFATAIRGVARTVEICHNSCNQYHKHKELRVMNRSTLVERRSPLGCFPGQPTPRLYDRVVEVLRARHYSPRTEEAYVHWIRRFTLFHAGAHPRELGEGHVNTFLTHLAVKEDVAASTQNQALAALLFLYGHVLEQPLNRIEGVIRARKPKRLPVVLRSDGEGAVFRRSCGARCRPESQAGADAPIVRGIMSRPARLIRNVRHDDTGTEPSVPHQIFGSILKSHQ